MFISRLRHNARNGFVRTVARSKTNPPHLVISQYYRGQMFRPCTQITLLAWNISWLAQHHPVNQIEISIDCRPESWTKRCAARRGGRQGRARRPWLQNWMVSHQFSRWGHLQNKGARTNLPQLRTQSTRGQLPTLHPKPGALYESSKNPDAPPKGTLKTNNPQPQAKCREPDFC